MSGEKTKNVEIKLYGFEGLEQDVQEEVVRDHLGYIFDVYMEFDEDEDIEADEETEEYFSVLTDPIKKAADEAFENNPEEPIFFVYSLMVLSIDAYNDIMSQVNNKMYFKNGCVYEEEEY